jgi:hypothetical protein
MAIYHFSVKPISRGDGRSAVAAAAYRSAQILDDHRYGKVQDYERKSGVELSQIYAPADVSPDLLDRNKLWNAVEKSENRKDACLAREFEIAFPNELNEQQRKAMLDELCKQIVNKYAVVVDASIHAPHTEVGSDERNYHAHIMFTTRAIDPTSGLFASKKYRDFNKDLGSQTTKQWREDFALLANKHLELGGFESRVDHRSLKDQGSDLEPTIHEGPEVTQLRRRGIDTDISIKNDAISKRNKELKNIRQQLKQLENEIRAFKLETIELEKQKLEQVQDEQLANDISRFYELQRNYSDFALSAFKLLNAQDKEIDSIIKQRNKVDKIISKHQNDGSRFINEYKILQDKNGHMPRFWISKEDAKEQINRIKNNYSNKLKELSNNFNLLNTASELNILHRTLVENGIELEIPREKKIFGIALTGTPPSAETVISDMQEYFFTPLGSDFKYHFNESIKTDEQKKKDAKKAIDVKKAQDDWNLKQATEAEERQKALDLHLVQVETARSECGYARNFEYSNVDPNINTLTSLIVSNVINKRDYSQDFQDKLYRIEKSLNPAQMGLDQAEKQYPDYLNMLESDEKFFKSQGKIKESQQIRSLHDKLSSQYVEKLGTERLYAEKCKLEREQAKTLTKPNHLEKSRDNDLSM